MSDIDPSEHNKLQEFAENIRTQKSGLDTAQSLKIGETPASEAGQVDLGLKVDNKVELQPGIFCAVVAPGIIKLSGIGLILEKVEDGWMVKQNDGGKREFGPSTAKLLDTYSEMAKRGELKIIDPDQAAADKKDEIDELERLLKRSQSRSKFIPE